MKIQDATDVLLRYLLIHDSQNGIRLSGTVGGRSVTIRNSIIYNNTELGIEGDEPGDFLAIDSSTIMGNGLGGIDVENSDANVRNTISMTGLPAADFLVGAGTLMQENNISWDGTAAGPGSLINRDPTEFLSPGAPPRNGWVIFRNISAGTEDFHLQENATENDAQDAGTDLSASFIADIDAGARSSPWDIGADDIQAATAVELLDFQAQAGDGAVELTWETGSEIDNVGFYLYRAEAAEGPFELVKETVIPGLGSSPLGAVTVTSTRASSTARPTSTSSKIWNRPA